MKLFLSIVIVLSTSLSHAADNIWTCDDNSKTVKVEVRTKTFEQSAYDFVVTKNGISTTLKTQSPFGGIWDIDFLLGRDVEVEAYDVNGVKQNALLFAREAYSIGAMDLYCTYFGDIVFEEMTAMSDADLRAQMLKQLIKMRLLSNPLETTIVQCHIHQNDGAEALEYNLNDIKEKAYTCGGDSEIDQNIANLVARLKQILPEQEYQDVLSSF